MVSIRWYLGSLTGSWGLLVRKPWALHLWELETHRVGVKTIWGLPKKRPLFGSPCNEDRNVLESNLGLPVLGNLRILPSFVAHA